MTLQIFRFPQRLEILPLSITLGITSFFSILTPGQEYLPLQGLLTY